MSFASSGGQEIQGWLAVPDGEGPFPTILETHGGPEHAVTEEFKELQLAVQPVAQWSGDIQVHSRVNQGTTFQVQLPTLQPSS